MRAQPQTQHYGPRGRRRCPQRKSVTEWPPGATESVGRGALEKNTREEGVKIKYTAHLPAQKARRRGEITPIVCACNRYRNRYLNTPSTSTPGPPLTGTSWAGCCRCLKKGRRAGNRTCNDTHNTLPKNSGLGTLCDSTRLIPWLTAAVEQSGSGAEWCTHPGFHSRRRRHRPTTTQAWRVPTQPPPRPRPVPASSAERVRVPRPLRAPRRHRPRPWRPRCWPLLR